MSDRLGHTYPGIQWAHLVMQHADVSAGAVYVAHALGSTHNAKTGLCCPSQETLTAYTRKSRRSVRNGLHQLREAGLIEVTPRQNPSGPGRTSDAYALIHPVTKEQILPLGQGTKGTNRPASKNRQAGQGLTAKGLAVNEGSAEGPTGKGLPVNEAEGPTGKNLPLGQETNRQGSADQVAGLGRPSGKFRSTNRQPSRH